MATALTNAQTWAHDPAQLNIRSADAAVRSDGSIVFAYSGVSNALDAQLSVGILDTVAGILTNVTTTTTTYPQSPAGLPFSALTPVDIEAGPGGRVAVQLRLTEDGSTADTNAALLIQRLNGTAPQGAALPVNPATPTDITSTYSALLYAPNGGYSVFFTEQTAAGGTSNGIRMASFSAVGAPIGAPITVIADRPAGGIIPIEANPIMVDAARMKSGNIALVWTESSAFAAPTFGQPKVMFQAITAGGVALGAALEIDGTSAQQAQIVTLTSGRMAVVWLDTTPGDQGVYKAQMLTAAGAKSGGVFDISSTLTTQETELALVATADGGFAVSWRDASNQSFLARMFDGQGVAKGNDFSILDTAGQFIGGKGGLIADGTTLYTYMHGLNGTVGGGFVLQGQSFSTAASWGTRASGTSADETFLGTALDDILSGRAGRDVIRGQDGNDLLAGDVGNDILVGGNGRDQLTGGSGADRLTGNQGADSFVFMGFGEGGDTITDFNGAEGDRLIFSTAGFGGATTVLSGAVLNTAHRGLFFNTTTGVLTYDADGAGASSVLTIAKLTAVTSLAFDDMLFLA